VTRTAFAAIALALVIAALLAAIPPAAAQGPVSGVLTGPAALAPHGSGVYFVNATGGPASEGAGNYSIRYWITGSDLTGGLPLPATPATQVGNSSGSFKFNVTAPQADGAITLNVEINSTAGGRTETGTVAKSITVVTPVVLKATFRNDGDAAAVNVPVKFYVDGKFAGATNISRIEPKASGTATLSWLPVGLTPGAHTVRIEADLNRNGVIEPDKGEVAFVDVLYKKDWELTWPWAILTMMATVSVSSVVIRGLRRRR